MDPQEGDVARGPNGETAVYRGGQWVVQSGAQPPVPGFVPFQSPADRRAEEAAGRAEQAADRAAQNDTRRVELDARTSDRQGIQSETDLRKEFNALPDAKDFPTIAASYQNVVATANNDSAAGDLSLIFAFMKILDPNSVVREQEFANAQNAAGVPDQIRNLYNRALNGERLNPRQRADFVKQAQSVYEVRATRYNELATRYRGLAESYGFAPDNVALPVTMAEQPASEQVETAAPAPEAAAAMTGPRADTFGQGGAPKFDPSQPFGSEKVIRPGAMSETRDGRTDQELKDAGYIQGADGTWRRDLSPEQLQAMGYVPREDGSWVLNYSDEYIAARNDARTRMNNEDTGLPERVRAVSSGMSFGLSDELERQVVEAEQRGQNVNDRLAGREIPWDSSTYGQAYEDEADARQRRFAQDRPFQNFALQAGGAAIAPGSMASGRYIAGASGAGQAGGRGAMVGAGYGAAYGAGNAEGGLGSRLEGAREGAMTGAVAGGALGAGGRYVGEAAAAAASRRPMTSSPRAQAVQTLDDHGVFMTPGQRMGGIVGSVEDLAQRAPILGPAIRGARERSTESLNRAVGNRALDPIGEGVPAGVNAGSDMVGHVQSRLGAEFDRAYGMVPQFVPDDAFAQGLGRIGQSKADLPPAMQSQFDEIIGSRLQRLGDAPSGQQVGSIRTELNGLASGYLKSQDPAQQGLGRMLADVADELDGAVSRANPEAGQILARAREGYSDYVRLERASTAAGGNPFSPAQLGQAVRVSDGSVRRGAVGRGEAQMQDLSQAAQTVLPGRFGNPGTADAVGLGGLGVGMVTEPVTTTAIATGLGGASVPYLAMGRRVVERLPANASRQQVEAALGELDQLARQDSNVIILRDQVARRLSQLAPAAADQSEQARGRLMTGR